MQSWNRKETRENNYPLLSQQMEKELKKKKCISDEIENTEKSSNIVNIQYYGAHM